MRNKSFAYIICIFLCYTLMSCNTNVKTDIVAQSKAYYDGVGSGNYDNVLEIVGDSLISIQGPYSEKYSREDYRDWLAWDFSFEPTYTVLSAVPVDADKVELEVKKTDVRINFLNGEPTVYKEVFEFTEGKLTSIIWKENILFNDSTWVARRDALLSYIRENHPDLDEFIYDQTAEGAKNYRTAISLYNNKIE